MHISKVSFIDKVEGYWVGQLVGNFMGLPFEFVYMDEPMPILPDTYYDSNAATAAGLHCNTDSRGVIPERLNELQGAYTDDDTDVEFVTLHAVKSHGLNLTYAQIAEYWKNYVHLTVDGNEALWFANKVARELMDDGTLPPATGSKLLNPYWWAIDPQLVNELWSVFYPGMIDEAVKRAEWGAQITSTSWGTHPTRFYAALYSAAFFESDIMKLYSIAMRFVPDGSPFLQGLQEVKSLHAEHPTDWRRVRQIIKEKYLEYPSNCSIISKTAGCPTCPSSFNTCWVSAMINGLLSAIALLYGDGDFMKTVGIAIAAGFDCDNQAATLAGLLGVVHGSSKIPRQLTHHIANNSWTKPFNNMYINERRLPLPKNNTISDIVADISNLALAAILQHGGQQTTEGNTSIFSVQVSRALFEASGSGAQTPATDLVSGSHVIHVTFVIWLSIATFLV